MVAYVYRPRRRDPDGKLIVSPLYRARLRLQGEYKVTEVRLNTTDRQVAEKKLAELITERERELAGLIAPRLERESAKRPLEEHLLDFGADLKALGRTQKHASHIAVRVGRLLRECRWTFVVDVTPDSFVAWRARQTQLSPKTLNEYLNSVCSVLNWMVRQGRIAANPLKGITRADVRGRQQMRRAFTDDELNRLLGVASPEIRLFYLAAAFTGLRVSELQHAVWHDLHLDHERPHIVVRASTTKNRKDATLPIHPQLLKELLAVRTPETRPEDFVFSQHSHPDKRIRKDMRKAGISRLDTLGRKLDFHALRYTFATKLASMGVSQRLTQELMRHSDPKLTANIYTDVTQLPTFSAVNALPWHAISPHVAGEAEKASTPVKNNYTATAPQNADFSGHNTAQAGTDLQSGKSPAIPHVGCFQRVLTSFAQGRKMERATGLEAEVGALKNPLNEWDTEEIPAPVTAMAPQKNKKLVEVAGVEPACNVFSIITSTCLAH